ncbi:unnamed protein product [Dracunculus medinensis]|uniref:Uncharacterized protein n=1 Tax=Dracunculus medinensis TaxID=318479 RepID=A0A0N4U416_DRAME|nr:unnamed protein product [Dracunculus medinensis]
MSQQGELVEQLEHEQEAGFKLGHSCADQIFILRRMLEYYFRYLQPTVDFAVAFDSIEALWRMMECDGVPEIFRFIKIFYMSAEIAIDWVMDTACRHSRGVQSRASSQI